MTIAQPKPRPRIHRAKWGRPTQRRRGAHASDLVISFRITKADEARFDSLAKPDETSVHQIARRRVLRFLPRSIDLAVGRPHDPVMKRPKRHSDKCPRWCACRRPRVSFRITAEQAEHLEALALKHEKTLHQVARRLALGA